MIPLKGNLAKMKMQRRVLSCFKLCCIDFCMFACKSDSDYLISVSGPGTFMFCLWPLHPTQWPHGWRQYQKPPFCHTGTAILSTPSTTHSSTSCCYLTSTLLTLGAVTQRAQNLQSWVRALLELLLTWQVSGPLLHTHLHLSLFQIL